MYLVKVHPSPCSSPPLLCLGQQAPRHGRGWEWEYKQRAMVCFKTVGEVRVSGVAEDPRGGEGSNEKENTNVGHGWRRGGGEG